MSEALYFHPLASFRHKALIALYENGTRVEPIIVDLGDAASRAAFQAVWPIAKMPVLRDEARDRTVAELDHRLIEYLDVPRSGRDVVRAGGRRWRLGYPHVGLLS